MFRHCRLLGPAVAIALAAGCGDDASTTDVGSTDAGKLEGGGGGSLPTGDSAAHDVVTDKPLDVVSDTLWDIVTDTSVDVEDDATQDVGADDGPAPDCTTDTDCDDANACSVDTCVGGTCAYAPVAGKHFACQSYKCVAVDNTTTACTHKAGCSGAGDVCGEPAAGDCPRSKCPFDGQDRFLDGHFPDFGTPYNDKWYYYSGETITNPDDPKFTANSCNNDSKGGVTRSSSHVRSMHKGTIDVTLTGMSTAQVNFIKATLNNPKGWVRAGLTFNFSTSFSSVTDIQFKYCASCSVSVSGPQGATTDPCGSTEFPHRDSDYNVINFSGGSCFNDLSNCSRWLINHEVGHALGLADREHAATIGKSIMNHNHYYDIEWPSDDLITMVVALRTCRGKICMTP